MPEFSQSEETQESEPNDFAGFNNESCDCGGGSGKAGAFLEDSNTLQSCFTFPLIEFPAETTDRNGELWSFLTEPWRSRELS
jgi:hypothetical protein